MTWRIHPDHWSETKAVKRALAKAGFRHARVGHGTGTAWAWLEVRVTIPAGEHWQGETQAHHVGNCPGCDQALEIRKRLSTLLQAITGRSGPYDGNTNLTVKEEPALP